MTTPPAIPRPSTRQTSFFERSPWWAAWTLALLNTVMLPATHAQSADWTEAVFREPQVRYLLADMTLGGNVAMYRDYGLREKDPDSREAIRLWDAGARVVNTNDFERKWVANKYGKDGRVMRIVLRGTERTILGHEVLLSTDADTDPVAVRTVLLCLSLGADPRGWEAKRETDPNAAEALRQWQAGARAINPHLFQLAPKGAPASVVYRTTGKPASATRVVLNTDLPYPETNVRYFMADIALGGSIEFYRKTAEVAHEMGCHEAVRRTEEGYRVTNLDQFERKQVEGKTLITRKGSNARISGMEVKLSSD